MVSIDPEALQGIADRLTMLREQLIPASPPPPVDTGFAVLTAACADFCRALTQARLAQADCVTRLGDGLRTSATAWRAADDLRAAG
jgi:hypothetical protein